MIRYSMFSMIKATATLLALLFAVLSALVPQVTAFTVEVMPSENLCFFEELKTGERVLVGFQVQDGPEYEVDFEMTDAKGGQLVTVQKSSGYEYTADARMDGRIHYCFKNQNPSLPSKLLSFYTFRDDLEDVDRQRAMTDPLEKELQQLKEGLRSVKEEQQYIVVREQIHRNTAESTNSRVVWWAVFQIGMLVGVCMWQVWYLKRFFEVKRLV